MEEADSGGLLLGALGGVVAIAHKMFDGMPIRIEGESTVVMSPHAQMQGRCTHLYKQTNKILAQSDPTAYRQTNVASCTT